ncbi:MAG: TolC family protein [Myxococcales bacterium]|nr:TolC family protein [Myxococcales bacterium]
MQRARRQALHRRRWGQALLVVAALIALQESAEAAPPRRGDRAPAMLPVPSGDDAPAASPEEAQTAAAAAAALRANREAAIALPPNTDVVPLEAILENAYAQSPDVQVARSKVELGDAAITGERPLVQYNPEFWLGFGARFNQAGRNFEFQSQLDQRLEVFGERRMRIRAARRYKEQLEKELAAAQWQIYAQVHSAYNQALLAKSRAVTAAGVVAFSERLLEIARRRAAAGEISELRVRVAEGEFAQARQRKLAADLDFRIACNRLAEVAGWTKGRLLAPSGELRLPQNVGDPEAMLEQALAEHPMIQAREAAVEAAQARLAAAKRDRMPEPMVGAYFSSENEPGAAGYPTRVALATVTIPVPIFFRNQREVARAKAELSVAQAELGATQYRLGLQIRRAVESLNTAAERVRTYARDVVPRFEENLAMLERAFALGEADIIEVFVARERFMSIQSEALEAYGTYYNAILDFETMVGSTFNAAALP